MTAREFCARFSDALIEGDWGDIDPDLFEEIADCESVDDISDDALALLECVERALS